MTDKPHRLLFVHLSAPGHLRDDRDAGGVKGQVRKTEALENTRPVSGGVSRELPCAGLFLSFELLEEGDQVWMKAGRVSSVSFLGKGDQSFFEIDIAQGKGGLGESASLSPGNFPSDLHPFGKFAEIFFNNRRFLCGDFRFELGDIFFETQFGGGILGDPSSFHGLIEDQPQDDKVMDGCVSADLFLPLLKIFVAMLPSDLLGSADSLEVKEPLQMIPSEGVTFERVGLLGEATGDPRLHPFFEIMRGSLRGRSIHFGNLLRGPQLPGLPRFLDRVQPLAGGFAPALSGRVIKSNPPVRGSRSGIKGSHGGSVASVAENHRKHKTITEMNREKQEIGQRNNYSWFESMRGSHSFYRVKSQKTGECSRKCSTFAQGGVK